MENKTIGMILEEAKIELIEKMNNILQEKKLPIYLFEFVVRDIYQNIVNQKNAEVSNDQQEWMKSHPLNLDNIEVKEEKTNAKD